MFGSSAIQFVGALKRQTGRSKTPSTVVITPKSRFWYQKKLTMALHDTEKLDDDLGGWSDEHLTLAATLGIDDVVLQR